MPDRLPQGVIGAPVGVTQMDQLSAEFPSSTWTRAAIILSFWDNFFLLPAELRNDYELAGRNWLKELLKDYNWPINLLPHIQSPSG